MLSVFWGYYYSKEMKFITTVGGFNPFEKYASQFGSFPQGSGWKTKNIWDHHPDKVIFKKYNGWSHFGVAAATGVSPKSFRPLSWLHLGSPWLTESTCLTSPKWQVGLWRDNLMLILMGTFMAPMVTPIFEDQPPQNKAEKKTIKTRGPHLGC